MKKSWLSIVFLAIVFLSGCKSGGEKTEIRIQLSEPEYIWSLVLNKDDSVFVEAYDYATKNYNPEKGDFLSVLETRFSELCPDCKLASLFNSFELSGKISYDMTNREVAGALGIDVKQAIDSTVSVLTERIKSFCGPASGINKLINKTSVLVAELPERNTWSFTVNRKVDAARLTKLLESHIKCGFWETYEFSEIWDNLARANKMLSDPATGEYMGIEGDTSVMNMNNALFSVLFPSVNETGDVIKGSTVGYSRLQNIIIVNDYLSLPSVSALLPHDLKFLWGAEPYNKDEQIFSLTAVKASSRDGLPLLDQECIVAASASIKKSPPVLTLRMNAEGARIFSRLTSDNIGRQIVFEINNAVYSCATVYEEISGGAFDITGNFTADEISDLAVLIGSGVMPEFGVKVMVIQ